MIRKLFRWAFKKELIFLNAEIKRNASIRRELEIKSKKLDTLFNNIDISVDFHHYSPSWAVISIQGKHDFIKFMDLGQRDIREIQQFLRQFDRSKVDCSPIESKFFETI